MVEVRLGATLRSKAGGRETFEVEAGTIMQVLRQLGERYPELKPILDKGVAVAIDGRLYRNAQLQKVPEGAEVYLMPRVAGG
ncbi:MAG: MoaD/ThiS family protein [Pseudomonadota bacterium]